MMVQQTHKSSNPASARRTMERIDRLMEAMFEKYDAAPQTGQRPSHHRKTKDAIRSIWKCWSIM